jgi:hypothetical protein
VRRGVAPGEGALVLAGVVDAAVGGDAELEHGAGRRHPVIPAARAGVGGVL